MGGEKKIFKSRISVLLIGFLLAVLLSVVLPIGIQQSQGTSVPAGVSLFIHTNTLSYCGGQTTYRRMAPLQCDRDFGNHFRGTVI